MNAFCTECGNKIVENSKFCSSCGAKQLGEDSPKEEVDSSTEPHAEETPSNILSLFDKFAEIHDTRGDERVKFFKECISSAAIQILDRIESNQLEQLLESAPEFKEHKHSFVAYIQSSLNASALGGYEIYVAQLALKGKPLNSFKKEPEEKLLSDKWVKALKDDFDSVFEKMPNETHNVLLKYRNFRMDAFQEKYKDEMESLSHAAFEKLEGVHMTSVVWGYFLGLVESDFRKFTPTKT